MTALLLVFVAQLISSLFRALSVHSIAKASTLKAVSITAFSDLLFYSVTAGVTSQVIQGNFIVILSAVIGGAAGNLTAMFFINQRK